MTDITELTLREKFEAWLSPCWNMEKLIDDDGDEQYVERYVQGAWMGFSAANTELVEALEKAQRVDEELCKLLPLGAEYMDPPDGGDVTPIEGVRRMVADYRQRIAELESRTVKLPLPSCTYADHSYPAYSKRQVISLLESLGITVVEGDV